MVQAHFSGEFDSYVEARLDAAHDFAEPPNNMLGYVGERIYIARGHSEDNSEQFVAAVNRPHLGESLHALLELMAPFRFNGGAIDREWAAAILDGLRPSNSRSVFDAATRPLHFKTDHLGVGQAVVGFERDIKSSWQESLADSSSDDPFAEIAAVIRDLKSFGDSEDDIDTLEGVSWSSLLPEKYEFPQLAYRVGLFAVSAWSKDENGVRSFHDHSTTAEAAQAARLPIQGQPDSYLGKLMVRYFSEPGEFAPRVDGAWAFRVGLVPGGKKNKISIRELAPWIQLPMHQPDLVNSSFIQAAEALVSNA